MNAEQLVQNVNRLPYPPTIWSHGWIYGMWYCGTAFTKSIYYGQFPATFVKRFTRMFEGAELLHLCCGRCAIDGAVNLDMMALPEVDARANVERLPFRAAIFDVVLIDPPYTQQDAQKYGVARAPRSVRVLEEAARVLRPDGWLCWLDTKYPTYRRKSWKLAGLIGVVTGFQRKMRVLSMFQKVAS